MPRETALVIGELAASWAPFIDWLIRFLRQRPSTESVSQAGGSLDDSLTGCVPLGPCTRVKLRRRGAQAGRSCCFGLFRGLGALYGM
jgi:hypothetical protein